MSDGAGKRKGPKVTTDDVSRELYKRYPSPGTGRIPEEEKPDVRVGRDFVPDAVRRIEVPADPAAAAQILRNAVGRT